MRFRLMERRSRRLSPPVGTQRATGSLLPGSPLMVPTSFLERDILIRDRPGSCCRVFRLWRALIEIVAAAG